MAAKASPEGDIFVDEWLCAARQFNKMAERNKQPVEVFKYILSYEKNKRRGFGEEPTDIYILSAYTMGRRLNETYGTVAVARNPSLERKFVAVLVWTYSGLAHKDVPGKKPGIDPCYTRVLFIDFRKPPPYPTHLYEPLTWGITKQVPRVLVALAKSRLNIVKHPVVYTGSQLDDEHTCFYNSTKAIKVIVNHGPENGLELLQKHPEETEDEAEDTD